MKKLQALYNDDVNIMIKQTAKEKNAIKNLNFLIDLTMVANNIEPTLEEPQTFNKAWNHPNKDSHRKWWEVICKEFTDMNKQKLWQ